MCGSTGRLNPGKRHILRDARETDENMVLTQLIPLDFWSQFCVYIHVCLNIGHLNIIIIRLDCIAYRQSRGKEIH